MERVCQGLHWRTLLLNDIIIMGPDFQTHLERLAEVLQRLEGVHLKLEPSKRFLLQSEVAYLGHIVGSEGIATNPQKIEVVTQWKASVDVGGLRAFFGFVGYYRQYIPDFATIAQPLHHLTGKVPHYPPQLAETEVEAYPDAHPELPKPKTRVHP